MKNTKSKPPVVKTENRGRKPLPPDQRVSEWIGTSCTSAEKEEFTARRRRERPDMNQSNYVRLLLGMPARGES